MYSVPKSRSYGYGGNALGCNWKAVLIAEPDICFRWVTNSVDDGGAVWLNVVDYLTAAAQVS